MGSEMCIRDRCRKRRRIGYEVHRSVPDRDDSGGGLLRWMDSRRLALRAVSLLPDARDAGGRDVVRESEARPHARELSLIHI